MANNPSPVQSLRLALFVSRRYLLSRKLPGAVNVITWVAMTGIALSTAALVIVLSVFNGFNNLIMDLYGDFDADVRIVAAEGRYLPDAPMLLRQARETEGVQAATQVLEGKALAQQDDRQQVVRLKGIEPAFQTVSDAHRLVVAGEFEVQPRAEFGGVVLGTGVGGRLGSYLEDYDHPLLLYTVTQQGQLLNQGEEAIRIEQVLVKGFFALHKEYDEQFVLADLALVQRLFGAEGKATAVELRVAPGTTPQTVKDHLQAELGSSLVVQTGAEQHASLYRIMENEKSVGYLVLTLILLLTAVNVVGGLSMVVHEKRADMAMLRSFGATAGRVASIFLLNGLLVGGVSGGVGLLLGMGLVAAQDAFHLLKLQGGENFVVDYFPVELQTTDLLQVGLTIVVLTALASAVPALRAGRSSIVEQLKAA
jgi:lipoprotein-releasing system permease protein